MSRTLNDDFEDDGVPGGSLDLEKGSAQVGSGVTSSYGGEGIDFDDDLYGNDGATGSLELDLPGGSPHGSAPSLPAAARGPAAPQPGPPGPSGPSAPPGPGARNDVPDLAFDTAPAPVRSSGRAVQVAPPAPGSSGSLPAPQAARTSGAHPAAHSGQYPAQAGPSSPQMAPAPPSEGGHHGFAPPVPSSSGRGFPDAAESGPHPMQPPPPPAKPTAAAVIAKYPDAPPKITQAPMYAVRVVLRQFELRTDLESLRRRRSPDVPLYEAALRAYDAKTFRLGMAINCAAFAIATFIFFLPVIIRFIRAD